MKIIGKGIIPRNARAIVAFSAKVNNSKDTYATMNVTYHNGWYAHISDNHIIIDIPGTYGLRYFVRGGYEANGGTCNATFDFRKNNSTIYTYTGASLSNNQVTFTLAQGDNLYGRVKPVGYANTVGAYYWLMYGGL